MIAVSGPTIGRSFSAAASVSQSFTANSTTSATPASRGSSSTRTLSTRVAVRALDPQAARADRFEMAAAGEESDVVAGLLQPGAEVAADASCSHRGDAHGNS